MTTTERRDLIEKIRTLPPKLEAAVKNLSDIQLNTPIGEGKWTPRQILHHIADANINAFSRMKFIATEEKPILKPYNQDKWAASSDVLKAPVQASLNILRGLNERWALLLESLPETAWIREGIHLENGKVTMEQVLAIYAKHGETHMQQIVAFRQKMNW